ncbi:endolytic transglycosylase MltG [Geobacter sp. DSM 9736]|uniref:endolytic transglycosylase MltG n=1 Tax=Geobacter sp. DSM 9736 TaxID=1277350 RepID=UPI000B50CD1F|nr:endolytic transglycosylase MltG [Geobacter sp. DSM 9736]SNB48025.1 UPF0755 protein [Geobacter sp. DSM 9736]
MKVRFSSRTTFLLLAVILLLLIPCLRFGIFAFSSAGDGKNVQLFDFEQGSSLTRIARELEEKRIVSSAGMFVLYSRMKGAEAKVKAGYYQFNDGLLPGEILRKMVAGEVYTRKVTVPEGYSIFQVGELLESQGTFRKKVFLELCRSKTLLQDLGIAASSVEGYLYPCTYNVSTKTDEAGLIRMMVEQSDRIYEEKFAARASSTGLDRHRILTLASMVDKEAVSPAERPLIASVFLNRLKRGMPLQSDPTAVYGIRAFAGNVSKNDIMRRTPYNTYLIKGLPPGPIGNPSREAVEAVLAPARTEYLYFVAKKDGTHAFTSTLEQHNQAVRRYLKGGNGR